jgi:class 3 adenylate cyclase
MPPIQSREVAGERRHLTVLFCDLVGSTAIAAQLDPEEWRETVGEYHRAAADAITRFGGHVVKYLGDGVMALFGWPEAHDNDAERAARGVGDYRRNREARRGDATRKSPGASATLARQHRFTAGRHRHWRGRRGDKIGK